MSSSEGIGIILGVGLPLLLTPVFMWWARRSRAWASLTSVDYFLFDKDKRFVHIIGPHTYMPDSGDNVDVYHHRLFDRMTGKIYQGGEQRGSGIDLRSEFITRTTAALGLVLRQQLEINQDNTFKVDSNTGSENGRPVCEERDWFESDTTVAKHPPSFGIILRAYDGERDKFSIEAYADGRYLARHVIPGSCSSFKGLYDPAAHELLFVYSHGSFYRIGICILNMKTGAMLVQKVVKPDIKASE